MRYLSLLVVIAMGLSGIAAGQTGDLGAQIEAADAALGANPGNIYVTTSGTISESVVSLSVGHNLVCSNQITISLDAGSYLYQNSNTSIQNCIISSTSTPITGEVQSVNTDHVELENVSFVGGGNLVYWSGVTSFLISDNTVVSITATNAVTQTPQSGYFLIHCSWGRIDNLTSSGFVFPAGYNYPGVLSLNLSNHITVNNPVIHNIDASYIHLGGAAVEVNGSNDIVIHGGAITNNANMDGILSESYDQSVPSSNLTIVGLNSSHNGAFGLNTGANQALGDGLDIIATRHVRISHCILDADGNSIDLQPGIWLFVDDDVIVSDSDISDNSAAGIATAGTPNVVLIRDSINRNQGSGVYTEWQGGTATNVGAQVTFVAGVAGGFGEDWPRGTPIILDGTTYKISSVTDTSHLVLTTSAPNHSSPVEIGVNTSENILNSVINDNGLGKLSGQNQVGISWADGTTGVISGVTSTNTGTGSQLYGIELANTSSTTLGANDFSGNLMGGDGINASAQGNSPTAVTFPSQSIGTTSAAQTVTFWAGAVVVKNLLIQASANFSQTNNCGSGLAPFAVCQIQITFLPTEAGTLNGSIIITDDAPLSPITIPLSGNAASGSASLWRARLARVARQVRLPQAQQP